MDFGELTVEQRAALTQDQVKECINFELMRQGVIRPEPPELLDETKPKLTTETHYLIKKNTYSDFGIAFLNTEDAAAFLRLRPLEVKHEYRCGSEVRYGATLVGATSIEPVELSSEQEFTDNKEKLLRAEKNKDANTKARAEFDENMKSSTDVVDHVWERYHEAREEIADRARVVAKFEEYKEMCDDNEHIAFSFLSKAYFAERILAALGPARVEELSRLPETEASGEA